MNPNKNNFIDELKDTCVCPGCLGALEGNDSFFTCTSCGTKYSIIDKIPDFLTPCPQSEKTVHALSSLYDQASEKYKGSPKSCGYASDSSFKHRLNIFKKWINYPGLKNLKILDIGCGTGLMTESLADENEVWGVDISAGLLNVARKKGIRTVRSSADSLPFRTDEFHLVVCMGVLPYYENPEQILSQICRVTRPNGRILITSTTNSLLIRSVRFLKNLSWKKSQLRRLYSPLDMETCLKNQGICVTDTCLGFNDQIVSCIKNPPPFRFKLLARVAAVLGTKTFIP
jgi:ubiquinone/menaquinone biosynthesis C-methylase UbiE/uncharacterized protein YbaR (Trm112 family)